MKSCFKWLMIMGGILFFVGSCAKSDDDSSSSSSCTADTATTASGSITVGSVAFAGTYDTACQTSLVAAYLAASLGPTDMQSYKFRYVVTGSDSVSEELFYYSDTACSTLVFSNKTGLTSVAVGDNSSSDYKVTYKSSSHKELVKSDAAETWREATYSNLNLSVDFTQGCVRESSGSGNEKKNLWNVTSTTLKIGNDSSDDYPSSVGSTEYTKQ